MASIVACIREPAASGLEPAGTDYGWDGAQAASSWSRNGSSRGDAVLLVAPLLSLTVVLTLAAGIGVNAAVFSVLNASDLNKLPIANADRFVSIDAKREGPSAILSIRAARSARTARAHRRRANDDDTRRTGPRRRSRQRVVIAMVTANYFDALGVGAGTRGRLFTEADGEPVARRWCAEPHRVAKTLRRRFLRNRAHDSSSSRALHYCRRRPGRFHRHTNRLQPGHLGSADTGSFHRRQRRDAWTGIGVAGTGRRTWKVPIRWQRYRRPSTAGGRRSVEATLPLCSPFLAATSGTHPLQRAACA